MSLPKIKTRVVHSESKFAWNVIGTDNGSKYKIARVPYICTGQNETLDIREKQEAYEHAVFISTCFNADYEEETKPKFITYTPRNINMEDLPF